MALMLTDGNGMPLANRITLANGNEREQVLVNLADLENV
jgi:hypothetical protein